MGSQYHIAYQIEVIKGGFLLSYPVITGDSAYHERELFTSQRKLTQKLKELLDAIPETSSE